MVWSAPRFAHRRTVPRSRVLSARNVFSSPPLHARALALAAGHIVLLCVISVGFPSTGRAQGRNGYGAAGRTIVSGGLSAYKTNVHQDDVLGRDTTWSTGAQLTLMHFWVDNFAVGGTLVGSASHLDDGLREAPSLSWFGGDLDIVGHIPLNPRLSLRLWLWAGLRWSQQSVVQAPGESDIPGVIAESGPTASAPQAERMRASSFVAGFEPNLLVHLSSSVAFTLGPGITLYEGLSGNAVSDYDIHGGPGMTYSFGPDDGSTLEDAQRFGAKGRTVMHMYGVFNREDFYSGMGVSRFVIDRLALGVYASGGFDDSSAGQVFVDGGIQAMVDLPVAHSLSVLAVPSAGYRWMNVFTRWQPSNEPYDPSLSPGVVHALQLSLPVYLALHLHQGLVLGVGPQVASELLLGAAAAQQPNDRYVRAGLASTIVASF